jgi:glycosyltransferase involved in cell wall biosynthesis
MAEIARTLRILIAAENASYRFGGEAVLPLHYFARLRSRGIEAWLIVHMRTRAELETLFPNDLDRIFFTTDTWLHKLLFRVSRFLPRRVSEMSLGMLMQLLTQFEQRRLIQQQLIRSYEIDLVHQPIPVSPRFLSLLSNLGAPVVIGPMNGGMDYPPAFRNAESGFSRAAVALGRRLSGLANSLFAGKKEAAVLLVANERTRQALPFAPCGEVIELVENGVDLTTWSAMRESNSARPPRFVFIGRLVDWKAVDLALEALALVPDAELEIIGNGPMREAWEQLAAKLGLSHRVHFSGFQPQSECAVRLRTVTALLLPSLYECGGAVVLEAMAAGLPVIATNWGGPADYLDASCGLLVGPTSRSAIVHGFASAMQRLIDQPDFARQMGMNGRQRVEQFFDWEKKIDRILNIYEQALQRFYREQST